MENFVTRSKYVSETISIIVDFADVLPAGTTIQGTPVISVALDTGTDPSPTGILYLGAFVHANGTTVEQRFRLGIPGVIYGITWQVSNGSISLEKFTYLAILPNVGNANPIFSPIYETSCLYPYELFDSLSSGVNFFHASLGYKGLPEAITSQVYFNTCFINGSLVTYANGPEGLQSSIVWALGNVGGTTSSYVNPAENLKSSVAWISGSIVGTFISYQNPAENLKSSIIWYSGSLT